MLCHLMLVVAGLHATGSQAYAPIQVVSGHGKGLIVLPSVFPGNMRGAIMSQKLSVGNPSANDAPGSIPYFTAKLDQTITWDDMGWCLEATGNKYGDAARVNSCSGAQTQKWNWIPDGRGHNMIQLKDTEMCLDAMGKGTGLSGAPIELRECGNTVARWQFEEPLLLPGMWQDGDSSYEARHVMITLFALAGIGAASLGAWIWQRVAKLNQDRDVIPAVMAVSLLPKDEMRKLEGIFKKMDEDFGAAQIILTNAMKDPRMEELMAKGDAAAIALAEFPLKIDEETKCPPVDDFDKFLQKYGNDANVMDALKGWLKLIMDAAGSEETTRELETAKKSYETAKKSYEIEKEKKEKLRQAKKEASPARAGK